jgi:integrase
MGRAIHRLSATRVANLKTPGYHADGGNLYFRVSHTHTRGWIFRFRLHGRTRDAGLGPYPEVSLNSARQQAFAYRKLVIDGVDPIERRNAERAAARVESAKTITFDDCRTAYIAAHEGAWRNPKHRQQWTNTLATYVTPVFGKLPVHAVDTGLVMRAVEPIWKTRPETASRVRGRIEAILDWAKVRGYRTGENPARWRGHLDHLLPAKSKIRKVEHHAALPYTSIGAFIAELRTQEGIGAAALDFLILTATRTGETIGATWDEIDVGVKMWSIAADRMKGSREHRVPLSGQALAILTRMSAIRCSDYVFPGARQGRPLSEMSLLMLLRRMERGDITAHGFRSTFRDWAAERTNFPGEVVEMALAHAIPNAVEAAYRRGDLFEKRRQLMDAWAEYCGSRPTTSSKVVTIRTR